MLFKLKTERTLRLQKKNGQKNRTGIEGGKEDEESDLHFCPWPLRLGIL